MTVAAIVKTLAKEFAIDEKHAQSVLALLGAGLKPPYLAHYRKAEIGQLSEGAVRRFDRRRKEFEELERRRESLLSSAAKTPAPSKKEPSPITAEDAPAADIGATAPPPEGSVAPPLETGTAVRKAASAAIDQALRIAAMACVERCELEDLFLPARRPEPEVQLAVDRGLGVLADLLIAPAPRPPREPGSEEEASLDDDADDDTDDTDDTDDIDDIDDDAEHEHEHEHDEHEHDEHDEHEHEPSASDGEAPAPEAPAAEELPAEAPVAEGSTAPDAEQTPGAAPESAKPSAKPAPRAVKGMKVGPAKVTPIEFGPDLARMCAPFVNPDRDVHGEVEALEGAMRILSDRLGRDPRARRLVRRLARKHGRLTVRTLVDERKLGRNRSLLRLNVPIKQIQGHRLLALRQAQLHRQVTTSVTLDESLVLPKLKATLVRRPHPALDSVVTAVAERAFRRRLLPSIEEDLRNELRRRAEEEAIRFLAQHLRQILLAPSAGRRPVAGLHVDARGDWTIVILDDKGNPTSGEMKIEAGTKEPGPLADDLGNALRDCGARAVAVGNGKGSRAAVRKLRDAIHLLQADAHVFLVNEAGVSTYVNSEGARRELPEQSVPARHAIAIGRRHQDPLTELLKVDPRHLGLGKEQSVISKANLRRVIHDTVESCVALVGCDVNEAPAHVLRHVPGLDYEIVKKLIARREERPFYSREELRTDGVMDELRWTNCIGFLRVYDSSEPLDRTSLHPEQYAIARAVIERTGSTPDELLGRRDAVKGIRRAEFDLDEGTWRDLVREISHPGRDPRARVFIPRLLPPDTDPKTLEKNQVVEGVISSVASFGAFVDLGIPQDGMLHISEVSNRYVRDARGLLSIGQIVRVRVLDGSGQRVELSLKGVPDHRRMKGKPGESGGPRPPGRVREARADGPKEAWPEYQPTVRAARTRRDGLAGASGGPDARGRGPGRGSGPGRGPGARGGRGGPGGRRGKDEPYDAAAVRKVSHEKAAYNPFATFFKSQGGDEGAKKTAPPKGAKPAEEATGQKDIPSPAPAEKAMESATDAGAHQQSESGDKTEE